MCLNVYDRNRCGGTSAASCPVLAAGGENGENEDKNENFTIKKSTYGSCNPAVCRNHADNVIGVPDLICVLPFGSDTDTFFAAALPLCIGRSVRGGCQGTALSSSV